MALKSDGTSASPCRATTHSDLILRAVHAGIPYKVIHNASVMNAVGCCGLQVSSGARPLPSATAAHRQSPIYVYKDLLLFVSMATENQVVQ